MPEGCRNRKSKVRPNPIMIFMQIDKSTGGWSLSERFCRELGLELGQMKTMVGKLMEKDGSQGEEVHCEKILATLLAMEFMKQHQYGNKSEASDFSELFYEQGMVFKGWKEKVKDFLEKHAETSKISLQVWQKEAANVFQQKQEKDLETTVCAQCNTIFEKKQGSCPSCIAKQAPSMPTNTQPSWTPHGRSASIETVMSDLNSSCIRRFRWLLGGLGSTGVICIELADSSLVVAKPSLDVEGELFATSLIREVAGICAPDAKLLNSFERARLTNVLGQVQNEPEEFERLSTLAAKKPHILLLEFCQGVNLAHVSSETYESDPSLLHSIGRVIAFDMICNNFDRVPLIWGNFGNVDNIMYSSENKRLVVIDCAVTPIVYESQRKQYSARMLSTITFLNQFVETPDFAPDPSQQVILERLSTFFKNYTTLNVSQNNLLQVIRGALEGIKELQNPSTKTKILEITDKLRKQFSTCIEYVISRDISLRKLQEVSQFVEHNLDALCTLQF